MGYYHVSFFLGAASGSILGGLLTDWVGYRGAMGIAAGLTTLGALVALFTVGDLGSAIGPPLAYALLPIWQIQGVYWLCVTLLGLMLLAALWRNGQQLSPNLVK